MHPGPESTHTLREGLAGYVRAVTEALGLPEEGSACEVTDTATAYVALARRSPAHPDQDLMLVWNERSGWAVAVEKPPTDAPAVLAFLGGEDPVPAPERVAEFVKDCVWPDPAPRPTFAVTDSRRALAEKLIRYLD